MTQCLPPRLAENRWGFALEAVCVCIGGLHQGRPPDASHRHGTSLGQLWLFPSYATAASCALLAGLTKRSYIHISSVVTNPIAEITHHIC